MNELIVINEETGVIVDDNDFFIDMNGKLFNSYDGEISACLEKYKSRRCIGKTDIKGKNIYADSSIVELEMSGSKKNFKAVGYFFFHIYKLSYEFKCLMIDNKKLDHERTDINWRSMYSNSLKIIGTLQEKKELL